MLLTDHEVRPLLICWLWLILCTLGLSILIVHWSRKSNRFLTIFTFGMRVLIIWYRVKDQRKNSLSHSLLHKVNAPLAVTINTRGCPLLSIGVSEGRQGRSPGGPNSFIFMQFSAKNMQNDSTFGSWRTPLRKILDPPLLSSVFLC